MDNHMSQFGIVVIGYNRLDSISRLLNSLNHVDYDGDSVDLIISLDKSGIEAIEIYTKNFLWKFGNKEVKTYPERLGLRKHILTCGDITQYYDAIAVLEDDLIVSPSFYHYMKATVNYYKDNPQIAGISLYNHLFNVNVMMPFRASASGHDVYFMQYAQSWGQIWIKEQWAEFKKWYEYNTDFFSRESSTTKLPSFLFEWPESSWLKYHIAYCVETNKYFVYPYQALTTCFADIGENCRIKNTQYHVPMLEKPKKDYALAMFSLDEAVCYDAFFERQGLGQVLGISEADLTVDFYGSKTSYNRYILTMEHLDYAVLRSFSLELRPQESNVVFGIEGDDICLYDTTQKVTNPLGPLRHDEVLPYYYTLYGKPLTLLSISMNTMIEDFKRKFKKLLK